MQDYKDDIIKTRTGNVGSSDAKMLNQIAFLGEVPQSAVKRLAVVKGLIENDNPTTNAMRFGDFVEESVFASLHATDLRWQSNPCITSKKYSRKNVSCITHVDFMLQDDEHKTLTIGECKATKLSFEQTRDEYRYQLYHHFLLATEYARELGGYKVKVMLCHYDANDIDLDAPFEFDASRLTVKTLRNIERMSQNYRLSEAMDIVDKYLETLEYYTEDESIPYEYLPVDVQKQFDGITTMLAEIKQREELVNAFKTKLYDFLVEKNIKSIKNDAWSITRVDATTSVQFDSKKYLEEFATSHPRQYKKLREKYDKKVNKKGYVSIKLNNKND